MATAAVDPPPVTAHLVNSSSNNDSQPDAKSNNPPVKGAGFGPMYNFMRFVGERSIAHFFRRVIVIGGEDVPVKGPFILCCTHFSTLMDVAIISAELPHRRPIHYWAKRGLYKRQPFRWILENSGNIQVDRKQKKNEDLFAGTFQAMEAGEAIGLFPEGGSYTEHRLHSMKAGAAWAALEYAKHLVVRGAADPANTNVLIVPAAINYTDKSRFRSEAIFEFGPAFSVDSYVKDFLTQGLEGEGSNGHSTALGGALGDNAPPTPGPSLIVQNGSEGPHPETRMRLGLDIGNASSTSGDEAILEIKPAGQENASSAATPASLVIQRASKAPSNSAAARAAVSRLTDRIGAEIYKMTIDAPDWTTWHAIKMAREIIWKRNGELPLRNLVPISNALVTILNAPIPQARLANETLCALQGLTAASSTDVYTLNTVARLFQLPRKAMLPATPHDTGFTLPPRRQAERAVPGILQNALFFARQLLALGIRLPYVLPLALVYAPAYTIGWWLSKKYSSHEEESMASSKSLCAFVIAGLTHIGITTFVAALFLFTPIGWLFGIGVCILIEKAHVWALDETYNCVKKLVIAWRMLQASILLPVGGKRHGQLGSESSAVRLAVDVVKHQPGIQWSLIKALRTQARDSKLSYGSPSKPTQQQGGTNGTHEAESASSEPPAVRPKVFNRSGRPACYRLMGVTRLVHAQSVQALHDLLQELEILERQSSSITTIGSAAAQGSTDKTGSSGMGDVDDNVLQKYRYLRDQMRATGSTIMPRQRRQLLPRRRGQKA